MHAPKALHTDKASRNGQARLEQKKSDVFKIKKISVCVSRRFSALPLALTKLMAAFIDRPVQGRRIHQIRPED